MNSVPAFTVCIPAAGIGSRMGSPIPKQFLDIAGRPVLIHTLAVFNEIEECTRIIVAAADVSIMQDMLSPYPFRTGIEVIRGGMTRQESVQNMLVQCADNDIVLIHDAARPCVRPGDVRNVAIAVAQHGAALLAVPPNDTIKIVDGDSVRRTIPRDEVWLAQTPQGAHAGDFKRAFDIAFSQGYIGTDDVELLERIGMSVRVVPGTHSNFKITTLEDLQHAETVLRRTLTDREHG